MYAFKEYSPPNIGSPFMRLSRKPKDPWEKLRFERNIEPEPEPEQDNGIINSLRSIMDRKNPVMSEYEKHLQEGIPENNGRNGWAKAAAVGLSGLGSALGDGNAVSKTMDAYNAPYERELENYDNKGRTLTARVGIEERRRKQDLDVVNAMSEYESELHKRTLDRDKFGLDRDKYGLDVDKFGVDKTESESRNRDRESETGIDETTGRPYTRNKFTGAMLNTDQTVKTPYQKALEDARATSKISSDNIADRQVALENLRFGHDLTIKKTPTAAQASSGSTPKQDLDFVRKEAQETIGLIRELYDSDSDTLTDLGKKSSGLSALWGKIPATEEYGGVKKIESIKNKLTLSIIQMMKQASKTGATGLGALNLKELGVLENAASTIDPYLGEKHLRAEFKRIEDKLKLILQDADETGSEDERAKALIKKYGGG